MGETLTSRAVLVPRSLGAFEGELQDAVLHGILVSNLAVCIARELKMEESFIKQIALAGMLHDIGKLRLGEYLYGRRKDTLAIEEMKYIRMHSAFSYKILKEKEYPEDILTMVYHHHENYDGTGYPDNLSGVAIPLGARILRCSDVFSALVSKRPYRDAFDVETAVELMIDEVKNFDMRVFLAFMKVVHSSDFEKIRELVYLCNKAT